LLASATFVAEVLVVEPFFSLFFLAAMFSRAALSNLLVPHTNAANDAMGPLGVVEEPLWLQGRGGRAVLKGVLGMIGLRTVPSTVQREGGLPYVTGHAGLTGSS